MIKSKLIFLFVLLTIRYVHAADFLIVKEPGNLSILNQYEQPVSTDELSSFHPCSPFQIINRDELLGDQITHAIRCKYINQTFFLIKDDNGNLLVKNKSIYQKNFSGCTLLGDTVVFTNNNGFSAFELYPSSGNTFSIKKGERAIRVFQFGNNFYILRLAQPQKFGWCSANQNFVKQTQKTKTFPEQTLTTDIYTNIQSRLETANKSYDSLFSFFNKLTQKDNFIPKWIIIKDGTTIRCTLKGAAVVVRQLETSTSYLTRDIEQILLGKGYEINFSNGEIIIRPGQSGL
jgi:hypothetical protein